MISFYNKKGFVSLASMGIVSVVGVIFIAFAPAFVVSNSSYNDLEYAASRGHDAQTISNLMGILSYQR